MKEKPLNITYNVVIVGDFGIMKFKKWFKLNKTHLKELRRVFETDMNTKVTLIFFAEHLYMETEHYHGVDLI